MFDYIDIKAIVLTLNLSVPEKPVYGNYNF